MAYRYDLGGNRLPQTKGTVATASTYDRADRVQTVGGTNYAVDANGNLTSDGANPYAYD